MLKIDREQKVLAPLLSKKLADVGSLERDLQRMIRQSADAFFAEMGESLRIIGEEVQPTDLYQIGSICSRSTRTERRLSSN